MASFQHSVFVSFWRTFSRWISAPFCSRRQEVLDQRATLRSMSDDDLLEYGLTRDDLRDDMFRVP